MAHAVSLAVPRGRAWGTTDNPLGTCMQFATSMRLPPLPSFYGNGARSPRIEGQSRAVRRSRRSYGA